MIGWIKSLIGQKEAKVFTAPDGVRLYAIGDIHGTLPPLETLLDRIDADAKTAQGTVRVIFLGDYVDRGAHSKAVVDRLLAFAADYDCVFLKGNHEHALLAFMDSPADALDWLDWGGKATLGSYGIDGKRILSSTTDWFAVAEDLKALMPEAHHAFYRGLALSHTEGDYVFVHAGLRPGRPLDRQDDWDLMAIRDEFLHHPGRFPHRVVHGHTPVEAAVVKDDRVNLDTGAFWSGTLTAAVIEGTSLRLIDSC